MTLDLPSYLTRRHYSIAFAVWASRTWWSGGWQTEFEKSNPGRTGNLNIAVITQRDASSIRCKFVSPCCRKRFCARIRSLSPVTILILFPIARGKFKTLAHRILLLAVQLRFSEFAL